MENEIKPCRFCGSTNARVEFKDSRGEGGVPRFRAFVECLNCQARGPAVRSINAPVEILEILAVENWNVQTPDNREAQE